MRMTLLLLLAVAMSELLPLLQSARVKYDIAGKVQTAGHPDRAVVDDKPLLACVIGNTETEDSRIIPLQVIIIQSEDQDLWDYYYTKAVFYTSYLDGQSTPFNCKTLTPPLNNSSPERCSQCHTGIFKPEFLGKCSAPSIEGPIEERRKRFEKVQKEVNEQGGSCQVRLSASTKELPLHDCMGVGVPSEEIDAPYFENAKRFGACYAL